jgi:hypothetical protein
VSNDPRELLEGNPLAGAIADVGTCIHDIQPLKPGRRKTVGDTHGRRQPKTAFGFAIKLIVEDALRRHGKHHKTEEDTTP